MAPLTRRLWLRGLALTILTGCATAPAPVATTPAPPAVPTEVAPPQPSPAHVWVPGHWAWRRRGYVWMPGHWTVPGEKTQVWVPGHWAPRGSGYVWVEGRWRNR